LLMISLGEGWEEPSGHWRHATVSSGLTTIPQQPSVGCERLALPAQRRRVDGARAPPLRAALMSGAHGCRVARQLRGRPADE